jgi:hypothetical protein
MLRGFLCDVAPRRVRQVLLIRRMLEFRLSGGIETDRKTGMRINLPHNTDKETARKKINERIAALFAQYGHYLSDSEHKWDGDLLTFSGSAKGFKANGTIEVTDNEIIINGKLPLVAKPFEPRVKSAIEKEASSMFA